MSCNPRGRYKSDTTERLHFHFSLSCIGGGNGNLLQCSCLENARDGGAWWAAVYGVAQSRTRRKRLSSSSITFFCFPYFSSFLSQYLLTFTYKNSPYCTSLKFLCVNYIIILSITVCLLKTCLHLNQQTCFTSLLYCCLSNPLLKTSFLLETTIVPPYLLRILPKNPSGCLKPWILPNWFLYCFFPIPMIKFLWQHEW